MTRPFRDPIIYPGEPLETATGKWGRVHLPGRVCAIGGESMASGTVARWSDGAWECRDHVRRCRPRVSGEAA